MNVLIVEDEILMRDLLVAYFEVAGHTVLAAGDGVEALAVFRGNDVDLVLLDIMMPRLDGFSVCRKIRQESDALIIMLTAREDEADKLMGFELGADDYVTKPFSPKVLVARSERLVHRFDEDKGRKGRRYIFEDLIVDTEGRKVFEGGQRLSLTTKEFDVLKLLVQNNGRALKREDILAQLWGKAYQGDGRVVDTNIKMLRKKLATKAKWIHTVINIGYRFEPTEEG